MQEAFRLKCFLFIYLFIVFYLLFTSLLIIRSGLIWKDMHAILFYELIWITYFVLRQLTDWFLPNTKFFNAVWLEVVETLEELHYLSLIHLLFISWCTFILRTLPLKKCICTSGALEELTGKNMKMEQTGNSLEKLKSSLEYENSQLKVSYTFLMIIDNNNNSLVTDHSFIFNLVQTHFL